MSNCVRSFPYQGSTVISDCDVLRTAESRLATEPLILWKTSASRLQASHSKQKRSNSKVVQNRLSYQNSMDVSGENVSIVTSHLARGSIPASTVEMQGAKKAKAASKHPSNSSGLAYDWVLPAPPLPPPSLPSQAFPAPLNP